MAAKPFSRIDGWPVAVGIVSDYLAMAAAFEKRFGVRLVVTSGIRTYAEQEAIFRDRYRPGAHSPYGDYRAWSGMTWGRVSGAGTVAAPGSSNHETGRSLDLADTGSDAGVASSFDTERNRWLSENCHRWGFTHTGRGFAEPWHFEQLQVADPFLGRGKPHSISSDDPGEPIGSSAAGGGTDLTEAEVNEILKRLDAMEKRQKSIESKLAWVQARIGGTVGNKKKGWKASKTLQHQLEWLMGRVGGSYKTDSLSTQISDLHNDVELLADEG